MAVPPDMDRFAEIERRLAMLEAFLDSDLRERRGLTIDDIRKTWRVNPTKPVAGDARSSRK